MSELQSISHNYLWMRCKPCEDQPMTAVAHLIKLKGKTSKVADIVNKAVCTKCGYTELPEFRIIYRGASDTAMLGAVGKVRAD